MKNIFLKETNKETNLYKSDAGLFYTKDSYAWNWQSGRANQHIYITSDDFIEEDDFGLNISTKEIVKYDGVKGLNSYYKKIILTTDQDLIGVQAIGDEFLEWFVNNSNCEEVEVIKEKVDLSDLGHYEIYYNYKIIIPKEEPKFENSIENTINIMSIANSMFGKKEEPKTRNT